ncbi:MAG TPA: acyl-CoA desaturase, partial [Nitrospinaceae bacterium]|nr:acyl-CoA desaturase [Nitrospinaceae bacterium]
MPTLTRVKPKLTFNKEIAGFFIFLHVGALLALFPFAFSWSAVGLFLFMHWLTASIGICFGYHRYLAHRGMDIPQWLANTIVFIGSLACQNGPIKWIAHHRMHHAG